MSLTMVFSGNRMTRGRYLEVESEKAHLRHHCNGVSFSIYMDTYLYLPNSEILIYIEEYSFEMMMTHI
jgi:hypothetical protein